jgi:hypothetical protein
VLICDAREFDPCRPFGRKGHCWTSQPVARNIIHRRHCHPPLLREQMRIKDARLASFAAHRRPHYPPTERLAILGMKAACGWSLKQTAKTSW